MSYSESNSANHHISVGLGCQVCGRHDASVRLVNYPLSLQLFAISISHDFCGRWCRKHRILYLVLCTFLTASLGWLAFPFGLFSNPIALTRLAKGRVMHKANNAKFLRSLADALHQSGNLAGYRKCLEASFLFVDDLWGRQELLNLYSSMRDEENKFTFLSQFLLVIGLLLYAFLLGSLVGVADYYWNFYLSGLPTEFLDIFFGWCALSALGVPVIFLLGELQDWVLERCRPTHALLAAVLALLLALMAVYGLIEGRVLGNLFEVISSSTVRLSSQNLLVTLAAVLTRGGLLEATRMIRSLGQIEVVHSISLLLLVGYAIFVLQVRAWTFVGWQKILEKIYPDMPKGKGVHELALIASVLVIALLFPSVSQKSSVDYLEARDHFSAGLEFEYDGQLEQAVLEFETASQLDPMMAEAYEETAYCYDELGDTQKAIAQALRSIEINPNSALAHFLLGRIYYFEDQEEKAALEFEKSIALDPQDSDSYLGLGWSAYYLGDLIKAEENFQKALDLDSNLYDAYIGLGTVYDDQGNTEGRIEAYEKAMQIDYSSSEAYIYLGIAYYHKNDLDKAVETLEKAMFFDNEDRQARIYLTMGYYQKGMLDKAVAFSQQTIELYPDWASPRALLAIILTDMNQKEKANLEIEKALSVADKSSADRDFIIQALIDAERFERAMEEVEDAIQNSADPTDFYLSIAEIYTGQQKYTEALQACDRADQSGENPVKVLLQRANIFSEQGINDQAVDVLEHAADIEPENAAVHNRLSWFYYEQGEYSRALKEAQEAIRLDAYFGDAYMSEAYAQLALSNTQEAIRSAAHASTLSPLFDIPHFVLGMCYIETGQNSLALQELNLFLEMYQDSPESRSMKEEAEEMLESLEKSY